jgi:hypothetical protein
MLDSKLSDPLRSAKLVAKIVIMFDFEGEYHFVF